MVKLYAGHKFIGWIGPPMLVEQLAEFDLGLFAKFIAICQITIGFMLLTTRFQLIGSIMMIPMILNILLITISQHWTGTPYVLSMLLLMNFYLVWQYRDFFRPLLNEAFPKTPPKTISKRTWKGHGVWLVGLGLNLLSIKVSSDFLILAFVFAGVGILLGVLAFRVDQFNFKIIAEISDR